MFVIDDFQRLMQPSNDEPGARDERTGFSGGLNEEGMRALDALVSATRSVLQRELIARIHAQPPEFFERLVVDIVLAMGYGGSRAAAARALGRSGDGGIDGVVARDALGFDSVFIQAKRLKPGVAVPISDVRDFAGALEARKASNGVFFTTTHFSAGAPEFCAQLSRRVVLVDGNALADLMLQHKVGVTLQHRFEINVVDRAYFTPGALVTAAQ